MDYQKKGSKKYERGLIGTGFGFSFSVELYRIMSNHIEFFQEEVKKGAFSGC